MTKKLFCFFFTIFPLTFPRWYPDFLCSEKIPKYSRFVATEKTTTDGQLRRWQSLPSHLKDADLSYNKFRRSLKTLLFGQWGHGAVWTLLTAPIRNIPTYLLTNKHWWHSRATDLSLFFSSSICCVLFNSCWYFSTPRVSPVFSRRSISDCSSSLWSRSCITDM